MPGEYNSQLVSSLLQQPSGGKQGPMDGMINKGAQCTSATVVGIGSKPVSGGLFQLISQGGAFCSKPGAPNWLQAFARSVAADLSKMNNDGNAILSQAAAAAAPAASQMQFTGSQFTGGQLGGGGFTGAQSFMLASGMEYT